MSQHRFIRCQINRRQWSEVQAMASSAILAAMPCVVTPTGPLGFQVSAIGVNTNGSLPISPLRLKRKRLSPRCDRSMVAVPIR